jgi:hypothetical protein
MVETSSAAIPESTLCSAHTTPPLPPSSRNPPMRAAERQWTRAGRAAPRERAKR